MDLEEFRVRFERQRAEAYASFFAPVTDLFVSAIVAAAGDPGDRALDLGCGNGSLTGALRDAGLSVVAADHMPAMATLARHNTGAAVVVADALRLPFPDKTFDTVAAAFLLPHLNDLAAGLTEARRVLRPGGRLVMTGWAAPEDSPFTGLAGTLLRDRAAAFERDALAEATRRTDPEYLQKTLRENGFEPSTAQPLVAVVQQPSPVAWWKGMAGASSGFADLLRVQPSPQQRAVRADFLAAAEAFADPAGGLRVPVQAHLLTAQAV